MGETEDVLPLLHPGLQRWIRQEATWPDLTPIQKAAIPVILSGEDCVIEAATAQGKTEAVLFPALTRASKINCQMGGRSVQILYLAPLKSLLNNLESRGERYAEACGMTAFKWHGDVSQKEKLDSLRHPPDLLMTTPESLEAILLRRARWQELFSGLSVVILDEAHNFAAGDRGGHLLCLLERVGCALEGAAPQRIAMSATIGNPSEILSWLAGTRRGPGQRIRAPAPPRPGRDFQLLFFSNAGEDEHTPAAERAAYRRFTALHLLLSGKGGRVPRSLVFVRSRSGAEALAKGFAHQEAVSGFPRRLAVRTHHSAVSKFFREEAERLIRYGSDDQLHAIISTSTLELGIDIGALDQVVQMDSLASSSSFLQRVGRTGRRPGKNQFFRGLLANEDDLAILAATVSLGLRGRSEALQIPRRAFHLLAHQLLCLALQSFGIKPERAWEVLSGARCFAAIARSEFNLLVRHMVETRYLRRVGGLLVTGAQTEETFLHSSWRRLFAVFDTAPLYEVYHQRQHVGTLDVRFVESLEAPFFFVLGGKLWRADRIDVRQRRVFASPSREGNPPRWMTFGGPDVPFETAQEVGRLLHGERIPDFLDGTSREVFRNQQHRHGGEGWVPGEILVQVAAGGVARIVTYAGDRINRTLARFLEIENAGKATADYREITLRSGVKRPEDLDRIIQLALKLLRDGELSDDIVLAKSLQKVQKLYPFSPFARCLPPSLWAAALVEQNLDPGGLLRFLAPR